MKVVIAIDSFKGSISSLDAGAAIREGIDSGVVEGFDPEEHLKTLKAKRANG